MLLKLRGFHNKQTNFFLKKRKGNSLDVANIAENWSFAAKSAILLQQFVSFWNADRFLFDVFLLLFLKKCLRNGKENSVDVANLAKNWRFTAKSAILRERLVGFRIAVEVKVEILFELI